MVGAHQIERIESGMIIARPSMKLLPAVTTLALAVLGAAAPAGAQDYPSRVVMWVFSSMLTMPLIRGMAPV
jgi:hypothetical protein